MKGKLLKRFFLGCMRELSGEKLMQVNIFSHLFSRLRSWLENFSSHLRPLSVPQVSLEHFLSSSRYFFTEAESYEETRMVSDPFWYFFSSKKKKLVLYLWFSKFFRKLKAPIWRFFITITYRVWFEVGGSYETSWHLAWLISEL